jgi:2-keto-4-pentenoate hydratase/2-oxohepta-3-ene-1,7-dioic acid hydratase in catechol pathway
LLAPAVPTKIIGIGRNYVAHAAEHGVEVPKEPLLFSSQSISSIRKARSWRQRSPARQSGSWRWSSTGAARSRRARGWACVLGITCGIDVTARDIQRADPQWTRGKGFDTFCPLGPWVAAGVTEAQAASLSLATRVNG